MSAPFILAPGGQHPGAPRPSPRRPFIGITSRDTGGLLALGEVKLPPLSPGPNQLREVAAGGLAWGARGTPHAFANLAPQPLRIMILWLPGGVERLFDEMEAYVQTVSGTPDEEVVAAINARYGARRVGPQIPVPQP